MLPEICTSEEDQAFAEICKWCYKTRQRVHTRAVDDFLIVPKPKKHQKPSWVKQNERVAIEKLLSLGSTQ